MNRFDFLHPVLVDLKAKHKAEIDDLQAKLEASRDLVYLLAIKLEAAKDQTAKLAEALEQTIDASDQYEANAIARKALSSYRGRLR